MKIIIIIAIASWLLYKKGAFGTLLHMAKMEEEAIEKVPMEIPNTYDLVEADEARRRLEIQASYIVERQGHNPYTVKYMSDDLLEGLIRDYIKACNE